MCNVAIEMLTIDSLLYYFRFFSFGSTHCIYESIKWPTNYKWLIHPHLEYKFSFV